MSSESSNQSVTAATPAPASLQQQADELKTKGNTAYTSRQFIQAVTLYSRAILLTPENAVLFSNRAAAWMGLKRYEEAQYDCQTALTLDPTFEKARIRLGTIEKEQEANPSPAAVTFTTEHSMPLTPPGPDLIIKDHLPNGKHSGLFAGRTFLPGDELFSSPATAVVFDGDCPNGRTMRDLLHAVLIAAMIDPLKHASLWSLYPNTDEQLQQLSMVSLEETAPEEVELFQHLCEQSPDIHPTLIIPPYKRFVRLTCGRFTSKQIHLLHHMLLYNSFSLNNRGGSGPTASNGSALYATASRLNHSCWPNAFGAMIEGEEQQMTIRAIRPIQPDEEITIAYLNLLGPRQSRRKILWETFEFICQCERCVRPKEEAKLIPTAASSTSPTTPSSSTPSSVISISTDLTPGNVADDLLESIICTNPKCEGSQATRGERGIMKRIAQETSAQHTLDQQSSAEYLPFDSEDIFLCTSCHHTIPASEVMHLIAQFTTELAKCRAYRQTNPTHLTEAIDQHRSLLMKAESKLLRPSHWFLPQLYSGLGGLYFTKSMQLQGSTPAIIQERQSTMLLARQSAEAAYHASRRVLVPNSSLLIPLLLTLAACCDPALPTRMSCVQEAYRIHLLNFGGALPLFQRRYARDLERLQLSRDSMLQLADTAAATATALSIIEPGEHAKLLVENTLSSSRRTRRHRDGSKASRWRIAAAATTSVHQARILMVSHRPVRAVVLRIIAMC